MHGLATWQDNHAEKAVLHFRYLNPPPEAPVRLDRFPKRCPDSPLDPFVADNRTIRSLTYSRASGRGVVLYAMINDIQLAAMYVLDRNRGEINVRKAANIYAPICLERFSGDEKAIYRTQGRNSP